MSRSMDLEGVHGSMNALHLDWARLPDRLDISVERWGAATGDEVAVCVHGAFLLPLGMEREDRCE